MNRFHLRCSYRVLLKMYIYIYTNPSSRTCMWSHALQPNCRQNNFSLPSDVGKKQGVGSIGLWQNTWMKCLWIWGHSQIIKRSRATIWSKAQNRSQKSLKWKVLNCKKMEPPLTWPDHRLTPSKRHQPRARAASRADRRWLGSAKSGLVLARWLINLEPKCHKIRAISCHSDWGWVPSTLQLISCKFRSK
jgi:hypothetical protein